jgi:hypothetical protein
MSLISDGSVYCLAVTVGAGETWAGWTWPSKSNDMIFPLFTSPRRAQSFKDALEPQLELRVQAMDLPVFLETVLRYHALGPRQYAIDPRDQASAHLLASQTLIAQLIRLAYDEGLRAGHA